MDSRYYDEMSGFPNTFSEMSQLYFGPVYTTDVVTMTPMLQPAYNPGCNVGMGIEMKTNSPAVQDYDGKINLQVENQVLSRLQWYNLSIKFVDGAVRPAVKQIKYEFTYRNYLLNNTMLYYRSIKCFCHTFTSFARSEISKIVQSAMRLTFVAIFNIIKFALYDIYIIYA